MAKKTVSNKSANKSDAIREILKEQPKAKVKEIRAALQQRGVKASDALINKIKYGRKPAGANGKARGRRRGSATSKADAIRSMLGKLGAKARPRDVIAALAERGVSVSSAQVSTLRKSSPRRAGAGDFSAAGAVPLDHLLAAKGLAERLGGIRVAQAALASLAKILEG